MNARLAHLSCTMLGNSLRASHPQTLKSTQAMADAMMGATKVGHALSSHCFYGHSFVGHTHAASPCLLVCHGGVMVSRSEQ